MKRWMLTVVVLAAMCTGFCPGCGDEADTQAARDRREDYETQIRDKHGKSYEELPVVTLVALSPHNQDIKREFEQAFSLAHALEHGRRVEITWRDVGGGSSAILEYLRNTYKPGQTFGIDFTWGGGEINFQKMTAEGMLKKMDLPEGFVENTPATFGGLEMYDPEGYWAGAAISGFGFLYNKTRLEQLNIAPPKLWDDLADKRFFGQVALADPTKSGSAATAYEMIVQSGEDWPGGWAKLLAVLGNAKRFYDGASAAADAVLSEAPVATCIDFYGAERVAKYPDDLVYVTPRGQTAFNPDPIGVLIQPPHPEVTQRFVDFVLSRRGQAMWALRVGAEDGPVAQPLGRQPVRKDVYEQYAGKFSPWVVNPYEGGAEMTLDVELRKRRFGVLRNLVRVAAVDQPTALSTAKKRVIESGYAPELVARFNELPPDLRTREAIFAAAERFEDDTAAEKMRTDWRTFFENKYEAINR